MEAAVGVLDAVPKGLGNDTKSHSPRALPCGLSLGICVASFWDCLAETDMILRSQQEWMLRGFWKRDFFCFGHWRWGNRIDIVILTLGMWSHSDI